MSTVTLVLNHNPQSIMAGAAHSLWAILRTLLLLAVGAGIMAGVFAVGVTFWLPLVQVGGCLALIALFAYVTFPRCKAVAA